MPICIITLGVICRITQYLLNPSLWSYEAIMAMPILERPFRGLLEPIYEAAAPVGFLFSVKALTTIFGESHYALRVFSLITGVLALPSFYFVAKSFLKGKPLFFAILAFALSPELCYWSHVVRPYSTDVLITVFTFAAAAYFEKKPNVILAALFAIVGALAVWFSYTSLFVLAGIGTVLFITALVSHQKSKAAILVIVGTIWLASLAALYKLSLGKVQSDPYFDQLYSTKESRGFMPFPPKTIDDLKWYVYTFWIMSSTPLGSYVFVVKFAIIPMLAGIFYMWRENKKLLWMILAPIILSLFASALHKYPYSPRHTLFFTPMMLILICYGFGKAIEKAPVWASVILACLIFVQPIAKTTKDTFIKPAIREDFRAMFDFARSHYKEGQTLYVYYGARYDFSYYSRIENWHPHYVEGDKVDDIYTAQQLNEVLENDLVKLRGKDVWAIFDEVPPPKYKEIIQSNWVTKDKFEVEGASCFNITTK